MGKQWSTLLDNWVVFCRGVGIQALISEYNTLLICFLFVFLASSRAVIRIYIA